MIRRPAWKIADQPITFESSQELTLIAADRFKPCQEGTERVLMVKEPVLIAADWSKPCREGVERVWKV